MSKRAFAALDAQLSRLAYKWAGFSHPNKSARCVITQYFGMFNSAMPCAAPYRRAAAGVYEAVCDAFMQRTCSSFVAARRKQSRTRQRAITADCELEGHRWCRLPTAGSFSAPRRACQAAWQSSEGEVRETGVEIPTPG
jgi:hypothetical protein